MSFMILAVAGVVRQVASLRADEMGKRQLFPRDRSDKFAVSPLP